LAVAKNNIQNHMWVPIEKSNKFHHDFSSTSNAK